MASRVWSSKEAALSFEETFAAYSRLTSILERDDRFGMKYLVWGWVDLLSLSFRVANTGKCSLLRVNVKTAINSALTEVSAFSVAAYATMSDRNPAVCLNRACSSTKRQWLVQCVTQTKRDEHKNKDEPGRRQSLYCSCLLWRLPRSDLAAWLSPPRCSQTALMAVHVKQTHLINWYHHCPTSIHIPPRHRPYPLQGGQYGMILSIDR